MQADLEKSAFHVPQIKTTYYIIHIQIDSHPPRRPYSLNDLASAQAFLGLCSGFSKKKKLWKPTLVPGARCRSVPGARCPVPGARCPLPCDGPKIPCAGPTPPCAGHKACSAQHKESWARHKGALCPVPDARCPMPGARPQQSSLRTGLLGRVLRLFKKKKALEAKIGARCPVPASL